MIYSVDSDQSENINKYFAEAHKENKSDHYMASVFLLAEAQYRIQNLSLKRASECLEKSTTHIEILKQDQKGNDKVEQANLVRNMILIVISISKSTRSIYNYTTVF